METNIGQLFDILAAHRGQDDSRQIHFNQTERLDSVNIKQTHPHNTVSVPLR